ncbi:tail fiber domain-containing protein [Acetobacter okinawensis]|uniref:tail fiber domain-containing protein n=1 Tax=Acetobacter okinawensis TaxID=1076594 RepID=UPI000A37E957|nr:tail fiber domain-containing protein [Acetobacter okinawensis]
MTAETQQLMNMTDQYTPYGNVVYNQTGTTQVTSPDGKTYNVPRFTQTTTLNNQQQQTLDQQQQAATNIASTANSLSSSGLSGLTKPVDTSGAPALQTSLGSNYSSSPGSNYSTSVGNGYTTGLGSGYQTSFGGDVSQAYDNAKNAVMNQLTPTLDRNSEATRAQELASGVRAGSAAYSANEQSIGDNYTRAANQATETAQSVQNQLFNQQQSQAEFGNSAMLNQAQFGNEAALNQFNAQNNAALTGQQFTNSALLSGAQFNNDARNQYLSQYYQQRDQPLNELSALLSQSQVNNANTATSATPQTQVGGVDYEGQVQNNYNQQLSQSNQLTSGLFSLGNSAMGLGGKFAGSDIRIKKDIRILMRFPNGLGLYAFRYKAKPEGQHIGFMAQEVMQHYPEAVATHPEGYLMVDYARAASRLLEDIKGHCNG